MLQQIIQHKTVFYENHFISSWKKDIGNRGGHTANVSLFFSIFIFGCNVIYRGNQILSYHEPREIFRRWFGNFGESAFLVDRLDNRKINIRPERVWVTSRIGNFFYILPISPLTLFLELYFKVNLELICLKVREDIKKKCLGHVFRCIDSPEHRSFC